MTSPQAETIGDDRKGISPWRVLAVIAGALFMAVMLNAPELEREAKAKPLGGERDFWVAAWKPFAVVSRALYLDKPREWADEALDRTDRGRAFALPTPAPVTPAAPKQLIRTPTKEEPLKLWIGGDSVVKVLGEAVVRQATESGLLEPVLEPQLSSGLTNERFFDWPREFDRLAKEDDPHEVFVVMFGANDGQGIITPEGKVFQEAGEPGWLVEYRRRVAGVMDILKAEERLVVWVGQPIMRSDDLSDLMAKMNAIYREEAAKRPWVKFLDLWPLFSTPDGEYDDAVVDDDGEEKVVRHPDGVHLVREGGERAARHILKLILDEAKVVP